MVEICRWISARGARLSKRCPDQGLGREKVENTAEGTAGTVARGGTNKRKSCSGVGKWAGNTCCMCLHFSLTSSIRCARPQTRRATRLSAHRHSRPARQTRRLNARYYDRPHRPQPPPSLPYVFRLRLPALPLLRSATSPPAHQRHSRPSRYGQLESCSTRRWWGGQNRSRSPGQSAAPEASARADLTPVYAKLLRW